MASNEVRGEAGDSNPNLNVFTVMSNITRELTAEELRRIEHEKLHAKHKGHEAMHMEMIIILLATLIAAQLLLYKWQQYHHKSYQLITLLGLWIIPLYFNVKLKWFRMLTVWTIYSIISLIVIRKATSFPLLPTTPRMVYKWFYNVHRVTYGLGVIGYMIIMSTFLGMNLMFYVSPDTSMGIGVTILFYGLYYGLLGRDCAEFCTDKMAAKMGYYTEGSLPSKRLAANICAVCGQELVIASMDDIEDDPPEKTYKLSCGHLFHEFCIRGWCIVGKKQICPYCKEKVDLKRMLKNPWERPHVLFGQLLDWLRYLIVWLPVIFITVQCINYILGLE
eukprot:Seg3.26 transcript_id=Seg3.26/GoldUCD/mRNA.D3Y31 product="RING finger protein 121" protein_id=Seg3.26/GoldUCD/D3Y31